MICYMKFSMNRLLNFFLFIVLFSLTACKTSSNFAFYLPNEENVIKTNIASEYYNIAKAYAELKKYDKAIEYYKLAMRDKNLKAGAYYQLGRMYALSKNWNEAEKVFLNLLKRDSENLALKKSLAYIFALNGKTKKSLEMYSRLFQDNPDDSEILVNYIAVLLSDNRTEEAQGQLLLLKQRFPDNSSIEKLQEKIFSDADKDSEKIDSSSTASDRPTPEKSAENLKEPDVSDPFPEYNTEF